MARFFNRSLLVAATALMISLPIGLAMGDASSVQGANTPSLPASGGPLPPGLAIPCGKHADVVRMLRQNFGEGPIGQGLAHTGAVAEVFIGPNGTWTIVATSPDGTTCMIGSGQSWQPVVARDDTI